MGKRWSSFTTKFDFVIQLPPEVLTVILSKLALSDVLQCMLVCRRWRDNILHHKCYWSGLLRDLGLSQRSISLGVKDFPNHRDFYLAVSRHQQEVRSLELVSPMATCYPKFPLSECVFMTRLSAVARVERTEAARYLRVEEIFCAGVVTTREIRHIQLPSELPVRWVHYSRCGCVYWADSSGRCWGQDSSSTEGGGPREICKAKRDVCGGKGERKVMDLEGQTPGYAWTADEEVFCTMTAVEPQAPNTERQPLLAGCDKCSILFTCRCKHKERTSSLSLLVVSSGDREKLTGTTTFKQEVKHSFSCSDDTGLSDDVTKLEVHGVFKTLHQKRKKSDSEGCVSHYALLQFKGSTIIIFLRAKEKRNGTPVIDMEMKCECLRCCYQLPRVHTKIVTSPCASLIGCIGDKKHLCVWEVASEASTLVSCSQAEVLTNTSGQGDLKLVALGCHTSIVSFNGAYDSKTSDKDTIGIYIIRTESGGLLNQVTPFCSFPLGGATPTVLGYLLSGEAQQWLCDVHSPAPQAVLTVLLRAADGDIANFRLIQQASQRGSGHYVQAVNYMFQH